MGIALRCADGEICGQRTGGLDSLEIAAEATGRLFDDWLILQDGFHRTLLLHGTWVEEVGRKDKSIISIDRLD